MRHFTIIPIIKPRGAYHQNWIRKLKKIKKTVINYSSAVIHWAYHQNWISKLKKIKSPLKTIVPQLYTLQSIKIELANWNRKKTVYQLSWGTEAHNSLFFCGPKKYKNKKKTGKNYGSTAIHRVIYQNWISKLKL